MTTTYPNAVNEMFSQFLTAWKAGEVAAIVGYLPEVRYVGVEEDKAPSNDKYWCRISEQIVIERQTNLAVEGVNKTRRYTTSGLIFVQLFGPLSDPQSMTKLRLISDVTKNAFRGKVTASGVQFANVRAQPLKPETKSNRVNVVAEFEYDEII